MVIRMRVPRVRWVTVLAPLALVVGLVVAACGGGDPTQTPRPPTATTAPAPPTATTAATPTPTPAPVGIRAIVEAAPFPHEVPATYDNVKRGGTFTTFEFPLRTMDPTKSTSAAPLYQIQRQSGYLVRFPQTPGFSDPVSVFTTFQEDLALSHSISADGKVWTFKLRPDVRWHNRPPANGRRLTAQDVLWTFERNAAPDSAQAGNLANVERFEAPDDDTFVIYFKTADPDNLLAVGSEFNGIFNREYVESKGGELGTLEADFVGWGPFMVTEVKPAESYLLERNPNYHLKDPNGQPLPYLDARKLILGLSDQNARIAAFRAGQLDSVNPSLALVEAILKTDPDTQLLRATGSIAGQPVLGFQLNHPLFQDVRIRRAINMSIDREELNEALYLGLGYQGSPFPPPALGWADFPSVERMGEYYEYNPQRAKELLAEAGYADGITLPGKITTRTLNPTWENQIQIVQQMLKNNDINVEIEIMPSPQHSKLWLSGTWPLMIIHHLGTPGSTGMAFANAMRTDGPNNIWHISDPVVDQLIEKAGATLDSKERKEIFVQLLERDADQVYRSWLLAGRGVSLYQPYVRNYGSSGGLNLYGYYRESYLWLDK